MRREEARDQSITSSLLRRDIVDIISVVAQGNVNEFLPEVLKLKASIQR